jgi:hypothetical protein
LNSPVFVRLGVILEIKNTVFGAWKCGGTLAGCYTFHFQFIARVIRIFRNLTTRKIRSTFPRNQFQAYRHK